MPEGCWNTARQSALADTLAAESVHPSDGPEKVNSGTEYSFWNLLILGREYRYNHDEEGLTPGAGLKATLSGQSSRRVMPVGILAGNGRSDERKRQAWVEGGRHTGIPGRSGHGYA